MTQEEADREVTALARELVKAFPKPVDMALALRASIVLACFVAKRLNDEGGVVGPPLGAMELQMLVLEYFDNTLVVPANPGDKS